MVGLGVRLSFERPVGGARRDEEADGGGRRDDAAESGGQREDAADDGGRRVFPAFGRGGESLALVPS